MSAERGARSITLRLPARPAAEELDVEGVIFDCDGLLVDSESIWLQMLRGWFQEHRLSEDPEEYLGLSVDDTADRLGAALRGPSPAQIAEELTARYSGLLARGVAPMPGAVDLVTSVAQAVPVAVASNGLRRDVLSMLGESSLLEAARAVCTLEDVHRGKPAPDLYLEACARIGVEPQRAAAFEDSPAGARAALTAGLTVVGVNPDPTVGLPSSLRLTGLDQVGIVRPTSPDPDHRGALR